MLAPLGVSLRIKVEARSSTAARRANLPHHTWRWRAVFYLIAQLASDLNELVASLREIARAFVSVCVCVPLNKLNFHDTLTLTKTKSHTKAVVCHASDAAFAGACYVMARKG